MERVKKHQGEEREERRGEGEKPTLILLTNQCQVSPQPALHTWSAWEGELALPAMVDKGVQAFYERCMDMTAMGGPDTPILHLPLSGPLAHMQAPGEGISVLQFHHPTARTPVRAAPAPQPPRCCWWSSSKQRSLSSASTFPCCSQRTIHYTAFRFSAGFFPAARYKFCTRNVISEEFFMKLCQLVVTNLVDASFSCWKCLLFVMCWSNLRFCFDIFNKRTKWFNLF